MPQTDPIQIPIEIMAENQAALQQVQKGLSGIQTQTTSLAQTQTSMGDKIKQSWMGIAASIGVAAIAFRTVQKALDQTIGVFVKYANEVRTLTQLTNESAEEMSRLVQVADDYKMTVSDLTTASRKLAQEGMSLNVETLAKLSDEYLKLNTGAERQQFLMENLGRSGIAFTEMLSQGSDAIRERSDAISDGLILDQEAIDKAREYEIALDDLNDAAQSLKISGGGYMMDFATTFLKAASLTVDAWSLIFEGKYSGKAMGEVFAKYFKSFDQLLHGGGVMDSATQSYRAWGQAAEEAIERTTEGLEELDDAMAKSVQTATDWQVAYTTAMKDGGDTTDMQLSLMKDMLGELGYEGAAAFQAIMLEMGKIDEEAITVFANVQLAFARLKKLLAAGISVTMAVKMVMTSTPEAFGSGAPAPAAGGGTMTLASWASQADIDYARAHPEIYDVSSLPPGRAGGGSFRGWAMVGDSFGGGRTPYTEYVYAPGGAMVYNQSQMAGKSAPPMANGGVIPPMMGEMTLSYDTIQKLASAIGREIGILNG